MSLIFVDITAIDLVHAAISYFLSGSIASVRSVISLAGLALL